LKTLSFFWLISRAQLLMRARVHNATNMERSEVIIAFPSHSQSLSHTVTHLTQTQQARDTYIYICCVAHAPPLESEKWSTAALVRLNYDENLRILIGVLKHRLVSLLLVLSSIIFWRKDYYLGVLYKLAQGSSGS
jgi:hypothetical protein